MNARDWNKIPTGLDSRPDIYLDRVDVMAQATGLDSDAAAALVQAGVSAPRCACVTPTLRILASGISLCMRCNRGR